MNTQRHWVWDDELVSGLYTLAAGLYTVEIVFRCARYRCSKNCICRAPLMQFEQRYEAGASYTDTVNAVNRKKRELMKLNADMLERAPLPIGAVEVDMFGSKRAYCSVRCARLDLARIEKTRKERFSRDADVRKNDGGTGDEHSQYARGHERIRTSHARQCSNNGASARSDPVRSRILGSMITQACTVANAIEERGYVKLLQATEDGLSQHEACAALRYFSAYASGRGIMPCECSCHTDGRGVLDDEQTFKLRQRADTIQIELTAAQWR